MCAQIDEIQTLEPQQNRGSDSNLEWLKTNGSSCARTGTNKGFSAISAVKRERTRSPATSVAHNCRQPSEQCVQSRSRQGITPEFSGVLRPNRIQTPNHRDDTTRPGGHAQHPQSACLSELCLKVLQPDPLPIDGIGENTTRFNVCCEHQCLSTKEQMMADRPHQSE